MSLYADQRHSGQQEAENHRVCSGLDPPWTQSHILPRTIEDPALGYPDCTELLPARRHEGRYTHQIIKIYACAALQKTTKI